MGRRMVVAEQIVSQSVAVGASADPMFRGRVCGGVFSKWFIIRMLLAGLPRTQRAGPANKNAPQDCEAFGAENETRTIFVSV